MRDYIYHDIETIPTQDEKIRAQIAENIKPPANYSKAETIAKWEAESKPAAVLEAIHKTGLNAGLGHVICIGFCAITGDPNPLIIDDIRDEASLIRESFSEIEKLRNRMGALTIVGHNWIGFDYRFITQRSIILGVQLPAWWPRDPKPWSQEVHDTMLMWAGARDTIGMDRLCGYLGIEGKGDDGMDGSVVANRWEAKDFLTIAEYCGGDVIRTRNMHQKIIAAYASAMPDLAPAMPVLEAEPVDELRY
jgi:hypothetical protein